MCMLLDQDLEPVKTQVRVGTAVDTVGQVLSSPSCFHHLLTLDLGWKAQGDHWLPDPFVTCSLAL